MPKLTKRFIDSMKPPESGYRVEWDNELRGFGARIMASGTITYIVNYRTSTGRQRRMSIGRHGPLTPSKARKKAIQTLGAVTNDKDPLGEREQARHEPTFGYIAEEYIKRHANQKKSGKEDIRIINKDLLPVWKNKHSKEISRRDVISRISAIHDRGAPVAANRTLALIKKMFNFGIDQALVDSNPCFRVKKPGKEHKRDRVLAEREIKFFWDRLPNTDSTIDIQLALKLILVTAQRPGEVIGAEWTDFDLNARWWTIPAEKSKNGLAHRVPLSPLALLILEKVNNKTRFLFPSPRDENEHVRINALSNATRRNKEIFGIDHFTPHDLRRSAVSFMASMGIARIVISKLLNHVESGVIAVYDRHGYDKEKFSAINAWDQRLRNVIEGNTKKIVPFLK